MYERAALRADDPAPRLPVYATASRGPLGVDEIPAVLLGNKLGIAAAVAASLLAAIAYMLLALPSYVASTQIIIDPTDLQVVANSLRPATPVSDTQIAQVEDDVRIITSTAVMRRVVESQNLTADPEFGAPTSSLFSSLSSSLGELLKREPAAKKDPTVEAARILATKVTAKREERTFVVTVTVTTHEAEKSARLADAIVSGFLQVEAKTRNDTARRAAQSLGDRLDGMRRDVEAAEQQVVDYKAQHNIVAAVGQSVTEQQLAAAAARLGDIRNQLSDAQSRYAQVIQAERSGDIGAVPEAVQSPTIGGLRTQLTEVMRREGDLAATLGDRHPALNEVRAQERTVRAQLHGELARIAAVLKTNRDRAQADLNVAQASFKALEANVTTKSQLSVHLAELDRAAQADRTIYESYLARTREVGEQERLNTANISVISPAQVPETKSWPPRAIIVIAAAVVVGLMLGVGLTLGLELLHRWRLVPGRFEAVRARR